MSEQGYKDFDEDGIDPWQALESAMATCRSLESRLREAEQEADALEQHANALTDGWAECRAERDRLREAGRAFFGKYDELKPAMDGAFAFQTIHGFGYNGPTWEQEINDLRQALEGSDS